MHRHPVRWVAVLVCVFSSFGCGPDGPPGDPPPPFQGSLVEAPECELSADCPSGTYCDLGQCFQACNTVDPCTGDLVCIPRGRCDSETDAPADVPLSTTPTTTLSATPALIDIGPDDEAVMITITANDPDAAGHFRIDPEVTWLRPMVQRDEFTGSFITTLLVDRTKLAPGDYSGTVVVRTDMGNVTIPVNMQQSLTGAYVGGFEYTTPRNLGRSPIRIELREDGGFANVRVDATRSPLFPEIDVNGDATADAVTTVATIVGGHVSGRFVQSFSPAFLGSDAVFDRTIAREFEFNVDVGDAGILSGTFNERWFGIFPSPITVSGTLTLTRQTGEGSEVGPIVVNLAPALPGNPSPAAPSISSDCITAAATAMQGTGNTCNPATATPSQLASCGNQMRILGSQIDQAGVGLVIPSSGSPGAGYASADAVCSNDWPTPTSAAPAPSPGGSGCVQRGNLLCAVAFLSNAATLGDANARQVLLRSVSNHAAATLFLVNSSLVDSYRIPYASPAGSDLPFLTKNALSASATYARTGLREILTPNTLEMMRSASTSEASAEHFEAIRRVGQLTALYSQAFDEVLTIETRRGLTSPDELRPLIAKVGIASIATLASLAVIANAEGATDVPELSMLAQRVSSSGRVFLDTYADAPLFGVPSGFVPFIYSPARPEPTNFEQNLAGARDVIASAVSKQMLADAATREFDQTLESLRSEIQNLNSSHRLRLVAICGAGATANEPNLADCGAATGEMAIARSSYETAKKETELAITRAQDAATRISNERSRILRLQSIRNEHVAFTRRTGETINVLDLQNSKFELVKEAVSLAAQGGLFTPGAFFASAVTLEIGIAQLDIQKRRADLTLSQELQALRVEGNIEFTNGMANIRDLLITESEMILESAVAISRAQTAAIQMSTLRQEVATLNAEYALNVAQLGDTTRRLANNPAFRVVRDRTIVEANRSRDSAIRATYLAALAFAFETNTPLNAIRETLLPALRATEVEDFVTSCLVGQFTTFRQTYGNPQSFMEEISLREDILGIRGPIVDAITGETVSEADQFRRRLLAPGNVGNDGVVSLTFATGVGTDNGIFGTSVCNDQVQRIQIKLIGDGQGDNLARVHLEQRGTAFQRSCDAFRGGAGDLVREYAISDTQQNHAVIQAGIHAYPTSEPDTQLFGRAVGASQWTISIPPGSSLPGRAPGPVEPSNFDLDLMRLEDIVIRVDHAAISLNRTGPIFAYQCQ